MRISSRIVQNSDGTWHTCLFDDDGTWMARVDLGVATMEMAESKVKMIQTNLKTSFQNLFINALVDGQRGVFVVHNRNGGLLAVGCLEADTKVLLRGLTARLDSMGPGIWPVGIPVEIVMSRPDVTVDHMGANLTRTVRLPGGQVIIVEANCLRLCDT